ncbi:FMN-dependent alpha-hydroxy acid dehydrogenase [Epithele typhae]|uniref:FMN-dependent alpha-hydroxy acid dehydrogenase n=1 Tax=Epithele typhae TaxID=378194 RepID=UPI002007D025|nr:FMN-dependent alpha-hydroxy acid dehydrogenase [Epithele typhae]KAH9914782.1 FMN-dependent alpha-hydroxy acid dehydrogenase [Epithele typhae]
MAGAATATKDMNTYGSAPRKWEDAMEKPRDYPDTWGQARPLREPNPVRAPADRAAHIWIRDVTHLDLIITLSGTAYATPLLIAPIGYQGAMRADSECATGRATGALGIPLTLSDAVLRSLVGSSSTGHSTKTPHSLLSRAKRYGYSELVVTIDTMAIGWRYLDLDPSFFPFAHELVVQIVLSDPKFMKLHGDWTATHTDESEVSAFPYDPTEIDNLIASGTWKDVRFLRMHREEPLVVTRILGPEDAEIAIDEGVKGIVVSNHGGRQINDSMTSLYAVEHFMPSPKVGSAQASNKSAVLMPGGIRSSADSRDRQA